MNVSKSQLSLEQQTQEAREAQRVREQQKASRRIVLRGINSGTLNTVVVVIALLWSIPTFGLFISSFRPPALLSDSGWWNGLVPPWNFTIENYEKVINAHGLATAFLNSLIIAIPGTILPILVAAFAAYAFAWMKFPGRNLFFFGIVALMIIPLQIALVPILSIFTALGLTGEYAAVWLAHTGFGLPFAIFLLRNFFASLPGDLMESAYIDGASHMRIFINIILPLAVPALASLCIFQFMWVWNDLLVALIFLGGNPNHTPLTVTVANLVGTRGNDYQVLTAAAFISMALPLVVFFSLQRYFVRGILAGSVKG